MLRRMCSTTVKPNASQAAFDVIRMVGAAYLVFFGARLLLSR